MKATILTAFTLALSACSLVAQQSPVDRYVQAALESNIALQRKELSYEKSLAALKEAKGLFFPRLSLQARYSVARGGRAFEIPIGDLMNPVYGNLNLINSLGRVVNPDYPVIPEYPLIANEEIFFLRETEHETMLRAAMPVFNSAILHNHKIRQSLAEADRISVDIFRRELVKEVKSAYFNYAKAVRAGELFGNTLDLVNESLRTTESLYNNHKVTIDAVYSARAEVQAVEQLISEAKKNEQVAKAYFNFLLNRDYDSGIELIADADLVYSAATVEEARAAAFQNREEFRQLNYLLSVSGNKVQLEKGAYLPNVNIAVDYGFQGTHYRFRSEDDFAIGSVVMSWNLFDPTTKAKVQQARIEKEELTKQKEEAGQQIGLQVVQSFFDMEASLAAIGRAQAEAEASDKAYKLVSKKYGQGQANLVELTNARTQLTNAEEKLIIAKFDYQVKLAELERATASYSF
jgi:outer membrane protein